SPLGSVLFKAHALLSSGETNARIPAKLDEVEPTEWAGVLRVHRSEVGGVMTLTGVVTAPDEENVWCVRGTSRPWSVVVDPGEQPLAPKGVPLPTVWVDFALPEAPDVCRRYPSMPFSVVIDGAKPTLYLNKAARGFEKILMAEHAQLEKRRLRDVL